jgi:hypothetical protein
MKATNAEESAAKSQRSLYTQPTNGVGSSLADLDVPSLISQILGQYQGSLVHQVEQVEKELKSKALAAVKDQSRVFHFQAKERLRSVELDVQLRFQAVLQRAQDGIFAMIYEEMGAIFSELEASFESLLNDKPGESESTVRVPVPQREQETTVEPDRNGHLRQQVTGHVIAEVPEPLPETRSAPAPELAGPNQNVRLELPPQSQKAWLNDKPGESESTAFVPVPQREQETTVEPDRNGHLRQQVTGLVIAEVPEPLPETKSAPAPELASLNQNVRLELPPSQKEWLIRFQERQARIEGLAASRGLNFEQLPLEQKDSLWQEVKKLEDG